MTQAQKCRPPRSGTDTSQIHRCLTSCEVLRGLLAGFGTSTDKTPVLASKQGPELVSAPASTAFSTTRRRLIGKQPGNVLIPERFHWKCNLCGYSFSAGTRNAWCTKKSRHINKAHSSEKEQIADRRSIYPLVPVQDLPWKSRHWTCSKCGKGLPWLPMSQYERSRDAHLEKCAPDITPRENFAKLRSGTTTDHLQYRLYARKKPDGTIPLGDKKGLSRLKSKATISVASSTMSLFSNFRSIDLPVPTKMGPPSWRTCKVP